jgi:hypothetical protein
MTKPLWLKLPLHLSVVATMWGLANTTLSDLCKCQIFQDAGVRRAIAISHLFASLLMPLTVAIPVAPAVGSPLHQCRVSLLFVHTACCMASVVLEILTPALKPQPSTTREMHHSHEERVHTVNRQNVYEQRLHAWLHPVAWWVRGKSSVLHTSEEAYQNTVEVSDWGLNGISLVGRWWFIASMIWAFSHCAVMFILY